MERGSEDTNPTKRPKPTQVQTFEDLMGDVNRVTTIGQLIDLPGSSTTQDENQEIDQNKDYVRERMKKIVATFNKSAGGTITSVDEDAVTCTSRAVKKFVHRLIDYMISQQKTDNAEVPDRQTLIQHMRNIRKELFPKEITEEMLQNIEAISEVRHIGRDDLGTSQLITAAEQTQPRPFSALGTSYRAPIPGRNESTRRLITAEQTEPRHFAAFATNYIPPNPERNDSTSKLISADRTKMRHFGAIGASHTAPPSENLPAIPPTSQGAAREELRESTESTFTAANELVSAPPSESVPAITEDPDGEFSDWESLGSQTIDELMEALDQPERPEVWRYLTLANLRDALARELHNFREAQRRQKEMREQKNRR